MGINELVVKLFNGKKMILDPNDRGLSHDLLFDPKKHREEFVSTYLIKYYKENTGKVFFDLGCNLGYYSILLSDYFDKIIGVEPVKSSSIIANNNAKINNFDNKFRLFEGAISYKKGYVQHNNHICKNFVQVSNVDIKTDCRAYTISEICELSKVKKLDFLKMDIEGYEYEIIVKGRKEFFKYAPERIFLEIHFDILGPEKSYEILNILKEENYIVEKAFSEIKVKTRWLGPFSKFYTWYVEKIIMKNQFGELYSNVDIDFLKKQNIVNGRNEAIEFIFKRAKN